MQVNLHFVQCRAISRRLLAVGYQLPEVRSQQPEAGSRKSALRPCPPLSKGGWRAPIYSLAPHCLSGGEGHAVARGDCRRHAEIRRQPEVCTTPLPTPVQGWVASAYILSCAPLLVRGERATQWRGGIAEGTPVADSRQPEAGSLHYALAPPIQGWMASAYILSCAPLLVRGERATQWRGGDCRRHASSRQPEAGSLHYALAYPCPGVGGERLYTLLRPTACQGGEGHAVARGGIAEGTPAAGSR